STTKLTMDIAEDIREMYKTKKYYFGYISEKYGVSRQMINNIVNNKSWVPEERSDQFPNTNNKKIKIYKDCNKSKDIIEDNHIRSIFEKQITKNIKYKYKDFKAGYISASFKKKQIIKSIDSIIKNFREKDPAEHYNMLRALEEILKVLMQQ
ncbi:MAG: hypothetical protein KAT14_07800, partial [Candidatus Marinimicrobia bacterium]|nr:hypothetical protein [Candidatus Neomarinimicrobiota bacterium]